MARGNVGLEVGFTGEGNLVALIKTTNREMRNFRNSTKKAEKTATTGFAKITGKITGMSTKFTELNSKLALVKEAFSAMQKVGDMAISGEIANNAETVFRQISGSVENATRTMRNLRSVSKGLLDDTTIQQFASGLRIAGVEMSQIAKIMGTATQVSQVTGENLLSIMEKIKVAAVEGSQGEFDKLGITINVNEQLQKQAQAQGILVSEMTKNEQVTARLNILTEKLAVTMQAAGVDTSQLSTRLRSIKTDFDNLQSSAEQALASFFTPGEVGRITKSLDHVADKITSQAGSFTVELLKNDKLMRGYLADAAGLTIEQMNAALNDVEDITTDMMGITSDGQEKIIEAVIRQIMTAKKERHDQRVKEAQEAQAETARAIEAKKAETKELLNLRHSLEVEKIKLGKNGSEQRLKQIDQELEQIKIKFLELSGAEQNAVKKAQEILNASIEADKKADDEKAKAEKKARKERRKAAAEALKRKKEEQERAALQELKTLTQTIQLERRLEIESARSVEDIEAAHLLELRDVREKAAEERKLNAKATSAEILFMQKQAEADEIRLIRKQTEEIEQIRDAARLKREENDRKAAERAAQLLEEEREEFQKHMSELAEATERVMGPLDQLVNHEKGASDGMKAFGASAAGTSAAVNVFANETDASKSATDRFVQGLSPAISASGTAASAFVKDTKRKALIQGSFETASSIAAFATGNLIGGAGHAAAAAAFFALAGKSGGGGGAKPAGNAGTLAAGGAKSNLSAAGKGGAVVVNVQGFALGSAKEMGAKMAQTIDQARETGLDSAEV